VKLWITMDVGDRRYGVHTAKPTWEIYPGEESFWMGNPFFICRTLAHKAGVPKMRGGKNSIFECEIKLPCFKPVKHKK